MPRPEREQLILDFAGQTFARDGYHSASMAEIARLADVSKPMVYAYFGSKEELYVAYINRMGRELLDRLMRSIGEHQPPIARLRTRVDEFLAFVEENRDGWRVLFTEMSSSRPLAEEVADLRRQIADAISAEAGLPPAAIDAIGHAIVGAGESLANWWLEHPEIPRDAVADWYGGVVQAAVTAVVGRPPAVSG